MTKNPFDRFDETLKDLPPGTPIAFETPKGQAMVALRAEDHQDLFEAAWQWRNHIRDAENAEAPAEFGTDDILDIVAQAQHDNDHF